MLASVLITFVNLFATVFNLLLLARVVMSWVAPGRTGGGLMGLVYELTEPVLRPIRRLLPRTPAADFSPLVAFLLMQGLVILVDHLLH